MTATTDDKHKNDGLRSDNVEDDEGIDATNLYTVPEEKLED